MQVRVSATPMGRQTGEPTTKWETGPQQGRKYSPSGNTGSRTPNRRQTPIEEVKCWTCGKLGHYASDCTTKGPKFAFEPRVVRMNYLQDAQEDMDYAEAAQDNDMGND